MRMDLWDWIDHREHIVGMMVVEAIDQRMDRHSMMVPIDIDRYKFVVGWCRFVVGVEVVDGPR